MERSEDIISGNRLSDGQKQDQAEEKEVRTFK